MQTTITASQPYTSHVTPSRQASASIWGIPTFRVNGKMQPARIFVEFDIADADIYNNFTVSNTVFLGLDHLPAGITRRVILRWRYELVRIWTSD